MTEKWMLHSQGLWLSFRQKEREMQKIKDVLKGEGSVFPGSHTYEFCWYLIGQTLETCPPPSCKGIWEEDHFCFPASVIDTGKEGCEWFRVAIAVCVIMFCKIKELDSTASHLLSSWNCVGMNWWEAAWPKGRKCQGLCHCTVWHFYPDSANTSRVALDKSLIPEPHSLYA